MKIKCKDNYTWNKNDGTSPLMFTPGVHDVSDKLGQEMVKRGYAEKVKGKAAKAETFNEDVVPNDNYRDQLNNQAELKAKADSLIKAKAN